MRCLPALAAVVFLVAPAAAQPPRGPAPGTEFKPPSPQAVRLVEARRNHLRAMGVFDSRPDAPLKEADVQRGLADLGDALRCEDGYVFSQAVTDLMNSQYGAFPPKPS